MPALPVARAQKLPGSESEVFNWRMPADEHPAAAGLHNKGMVQVERRDSRASNRRKTDNLGSLGAPAKMIAPLVPSWMKQRNLFARSRIFGFALRAFELVAGVAGHAQIFPDRLTTSGFGDNMVYYQSSTTDGGGCVTISATVLEFSHQALPPGSRDVCPRH